MVERHHDRRRQKHPPIAIKGKDHQRPKDMEVRFDPSTRQRNEQSGHQHLRHRDHVPGGEAAGPDSRHPDREKTDRAADEDRRPDMNVDLAGSAIPSARRNQKGNDDARQPLEKHQFGEKLIGLAKDLPLMLLKQLFSAIVG